MPSYPRGYLISYKALGPASGVEIDPRQMGGPLFLISQYCKEKGLVPLHALVVRAREGSPGTGFFGAVGTEAATLDEGAQLQMWYEWARECIENGNFVNAT